MIYKLDEEDSKIVFLLKTLNKDYLESTLDGTICFNFPETFKKGTENYTFAGQKDEFDSHLFYDAKSIYVAEVIKDTSNSFECGTPKLLSTDARVYETDDICKKTPITCFRIIEEKDLIKKGTGYIYKLGSLADRITKDFGHDAFILICFPEVFFERLSQTTSIFRKRIHYGKADTAFIDFIEKSTFCQKKMFQKREEYRWQNEYRAIIPPRDGNGPQLINIGSIRDIAFGGEIDKLRLGYEFNFMA